MQKSPHIFQLKVSLSDIKPPVWRRLLIPSDATFWELHIAIQDSFGWSDCHLHQFFVGPAWDKDAVRIAIASYGDDEAEEARDESTTTLQEFLSEEKPRLSYAYDFGDNWEHKIILEKVLPRSAQEAYPQVVAGKRACPWDDSGGPGGYEYMIEVLKDKKHADYQEIAEWVGVDDLSDLDLVSFEPEDVAFRNPATELQRFKEFMSI